MGLVFITAAVLAIDLPTAATSPALLEPNAHRARVTLTADAIVVRPKGSAAEKKVAALKNWVPAGPDVDGRKIVPLAAALAPPKPENEELPERFFSSEVDGWVELYVDRGAPWALVLSVMYTASEQAVVFGFAVRTPDGDRVLVISVPEPGAEKVDVLTLGLQRDALLIATDGTDKKTKRTVESVRAAVTAFAKKKAKGRRPLLPGSMMPVCIDAKDEVVPALQCWRARVMVAADNAIAWGDALPLALAAAETVPWVVFGSF